MNRGAWWATVHRVTKSQTRLKQLIARRHACMHGEEHLKSHGLRVKGIFWPIQTEVFENMSSIK